MRITLTPYFARKIEAYKTGESAPVQQVSRAIMRMARSNAAKTVVAANTLLQELEKARGDARILRLNRTRDEDPEAYFQVYSEEQFSNDVVAEVSRLFKEALNDGEIDRYSAETCVISLKLASRIPSSTYGLQEFISQLSDCDDYDEAIEWMVNNLDIRRCDHCEEWEFSRKLVRIWDDSGYICSECQAGSFTWSEYYDAYVHGDDVRRARDEDGEIVYISQDDDNFTYNEDLDSWVHVNYDPIEPVIRSYHSSKRDQRPQDDEWTKSNKRHIGVELEVEVQSGYDREDRAYSIHDVVNEGEFGKKVFFESDGSLSHGFEIITQPVSLPAHRALWQWLNNKTLTRGLKSHQTNTCGLHVHISRNGLSALQVGKIVSFVNAPENESLVTAIARRYGQAATGYCRIKDKSKIGQAHKSSDRYEAVNVTPRNTIEFRVFKGTLKYESVISAIEFANALVEFTKPYSGYGCNDMKADCFLDFIATKMPQETKTLRAYINNRLEVA